MTQISNITNITNPGAEPADWDILQYTYENGMVVKKQFLTPSDPLQTAEEVAAAARSWRDAELSGTDWIVPLSDHPQRAAYLTYRTALRNWPTTSDFPATKPALGS